MDIQIFQQTYLQVEKINKGGTGVIYRAYHRNLGKYVVLKNIELNNDLNLVRREVDILKNLRHSFLPTIYDFIEVEGSYFIVEDYIQGTDLDSYFKNRIMVPEQNIIKWLNQMCEVLTYLHTRKPIIIHSDIKPGNIMIDDQGDICLIDFNISILHDSDAVVLGYSNYFCSPEQMAQANAIKNGYGASAVKVDHRSDIYSVAATFYALICGELPVCGRRNMPLSNMVLPYSEGLVRIIDKGMEEMPQRRFQTAKQMSAALNHTKWFTLKYKKYRILRNTLSILGTIIFVSGVISLIYGENERVRSSYERDFQNISYEFQLKGATIEVSKAASELLNDDRYTGILKKNVIDEANLYAINAEYQFSLDTQIGYFYAMEDYKKALDIVSSKSDNFEYIQKFALNYITSAALAGYKTEAKLAVNEYFDSGNEVLINAIEGEIAYSQNDYAGVIEYANKVKDITDSRSNEMKIKLFNIAALSEEKTGNFSGTVFWRKEINNLSSTDETKRLLLIASLNAGIYSSDINQKNEFLRQVQECYIAIAIKTPSDKINYAETLYYFDRYDECLELLNSVYVDDPVLLCKKAYVLSLTYYAKNNKSEAVRCCQEAVTYFNQLSDARKKEIDSSSLESLMQVLGMGVKLKK